VWVWSIRCGEFGVRSPLGIVLSFLLSFVCISYPSTLFHVLTILIPQRRFLQDKLNASSVRPSVVGIFSVLQVRKQELRTQARTHARVGGYLQAKLTNAGWYTNTNTNFNATVAITQARARA
jgi:hypothetical protein